MRLPEALHTIPAASLGVDRRSGKPTPKGACFAPSLRSCRFLRNDGRAGAPAVRLLPGAALDVRGCHAYDLGQCELAVIRGYEASALKLERAGHVQDV